MRPKKGKNEENTSASCTIRKEACTSDPERLSVSDNKLQVGELTGELRVARHYHHLNRLKSVLSESSVVDEFVMKSALKSDIDSPKSAENVFNPKTAGEPPSGGLKVKIILSVMIKNSCLAEKKRW